MKDKYEKLNETFEIEPSKDVNDLTVSPEITNVEVQKDRSSNDVIKDYEYTRGNLYSLIEKGQEAINSILELAQETDQPRAYEVAGQLIKNVADATDKLLDLQKKLKDVEEGGAIKNTTNVTNALFVGSTAELAKLLKNHKNI
jgi:Terminase DNA packaging enzyme